MLRKWEKLPKGMKIPEIRKYYDVLSDRRGQLMVKRLSDIILAGLLLVILAVPMLLVALMIVIDSPGGVFYRQERVTSYGRVFRIHKFRTMVKDAERLGTSVTVGNDPRITKMGEFLRKYRIDEFPQLLDIICGNMTFVGARPEAVKYAKKYKKEMRATLLLPAGLTSEASIKFRNEAELLKNVENVDEKYINEIQPEKMKYNLDYLMKFSLLKDIKIMIMTVVAVLGR